MKTILRILTLVCYFLPFTFFVKTCVGPEMKLAYNKNEVAVNKEAALTYEKQKHLQDSIVSLHMSDTSQDHLSQAPAIDTRKADTARKSASSNVPPEKQNKFKSKLNNFAWSLYSVWERVKMPTDASLSGIGTIFSYKNIFGKMLVGLSFIISLLLLFNTKYIKTGRRKTILLATNILSLIIFLVVSLLSSVSLLWGFWLLLILLFVELYNEVVTKNDATQE
jgi:hypothetical protein